MWWKRSHPLFHLASVYHRAVSMARKIFISFVKEKLSFSDYNSAISILNTLDEDGNISEPRNGSW